MAKAKQEDVLRLPLDIISASVGVALDLGGSALKLLYRSKEDFKDGKLLKDSEDGKGPIRLAIWPKEDIDGLITFIKESADITPLSNNGNIFSAGMGGNMLKGVLEEKLRLKVVNVQEFICLPKGLMWLLKNVPRDQMFLPINKEAEAMAKREHEGNMILAGPVADIKVPEEPAKFFSRRSEDDPSYPFMLVLCGSAFLMIKVNEDGSIEFLEASPMGGRFYMGITRMLAGVKDHDTLVEMMTSSDGRSVDMYTSEMTSAGADDEYSVFHNNDINLFPLGKCNFKPREINTNGKTIRQYEVEYRNLIDSDLVFNQRPILGITLSQHKIPVEAGSYGFSIEELKDGDLVHSFTTVTCKNLVQMVHILANKHKLKKVYFCGNFVAADFIRTTIAAHVMTRCILAPEEDRIGIQFLRYGGHLVALGAFLKHEES